MQQRECRYLTDLSTPQAIDSHGRAIWWCNCGNFTTTSPSALKIHVEGNDDDDDVPIYGPLAFLVLFSSFMYWKTEGNIFSVLLSLISLFISAFFANIALQRYRIWKQKKIDNEFLEKFKNVTLPEPIKRYTAEHLKFIEENCPEYDAEDPNLQSLKRFSNIIMKSECTFAKASKVWGSYDWNDQLSLEENVLKSLKMLYKGLNIGEEIKLDGFLFEIRGSHFGDTVERFGETVRRVLTTISDYDPGCDHMMDNELISRRGWRFMFGGHSIFVTCFAPCYPSNHARYPFGDNESSYVLLQPMFSFSIHKIGADHPWDDNKKTIRQKIRQAFKNAGREYFVPKARFYPMAPMIVPPLNIGEPLLEWYKKPENEKPKNLHNFEH